jgi:two-component system, NtrC family, nitrogen regulation sensor histidine kinase NtrY
MDAIPPSSTSVRRRRRRERLLVGITIALIVLFGFLEGWIFRFDANFPIGSNILLFALINLNAILLLLLTYFVLRNIVKLIFERKHKILGHKLRTRLVVAFVGLTLAPTLPLFLIATQFISSSIDYWFSNRVEQSLQEAVTIAQDYLQEEQKAFRSDVDLALGDLRQLDAAAALETLIPEQIPLELLKRHHLTGLLLLGANDSILWQRWETPSPTVDVQALPASWKDGPDKVESTPSIQIVSLDNQQQLLIARLSQWQTGPTPKKFDPGLVMLRILPLRITEKLTAVASGYDNYLQLKLLQNPLKTSHFITFSIITLLVIFAAIWFGFFLAKSITMPIQQMVAATQRIAHGDLSVRVDLERDDEIGMLVSSFNKMVRDLQEIQDQLANAYRALQESHRELEERRAYMEIVLKNTAAGVVSVDATGRIMTLNKSAEAIFGVKAEETLGLPYYGFLQPTQMEIVDSFLEMHRTNPQPNLERQVHIVIGNQPLTILTKASTLKDDRGNFLGTVILFEDMTDFEKAQRMVAWREVARRIAHEVKNPLTPIKLSAQRLRRKYSELLASQGSVLDECTRTIIEQVDHMKLLVDEFSNFARLPRAKRVPSDLGSIVQESLTLYRNNYPHISFSLWQGENFPMLNLDRDQFKQVMINLLDNAIHALNGEENRIEIRLIYNEVLKIAMLECSDTGHGLSPEDKLRIFEPYYSTKEKGTGLGLTIVSAIVADHNGYIRLRDNVPRGTVIIIELPGQETDK